MKFMCKNWLKIIIVAVIAWLLISYLDGKRAGKEYERKIETLDNDITQKENKIKVIKKENVTLKDEREKNKAIIAADKVKMREDEEEIATIRAKVGKLEERVKDLPISVIVIKTRLALNTKEVWERPEGVLFSLEASKTNLAILQGFSLIKEDRDKLQVNYDRAFKALEKAEGIFALDEEMFYNFDDINFNLEGIIDAKDEKFDLSEKRFKASWWKGFKQGVPIGGGIVLLIWLVLGR